MLVAPLLLALKIQATGECPSAADVERELQPLLGDAVAAHDVATIARAAEGAVALSLADATGQSIGARTLPRARTCAEQAKAVAVTLAVWEAELHPEISLALDRLASSEGPAPPETRPEDEAALARVVLPPPPPPPLPAAPAAVDLSVGVAAAGDLQSTTWAPGGRLELGLGPANARWRARLSVAAVGRHRMDLSPGAASWWRAFAQLGVDVDVARGPRWAVALGAGALGGVVSIAGTGFDVDRATRSLDLGAEARARVEARLGETGRVRPWVGAAVQVWVRRQSLNIQGSSADATLPHTAPLAALGVDFVW